MIFKNWNTTLFPWTGYLLNEIESTKTKYLLIKIKCLVLWKILKTNLYLHQRAEESYIKFIKVVEQSNTLDWTFILIKIFREKKLKETDNVILWDFLYFIGFGWSDIFEILDLDDWISLKYWIKHYINSFISFQILHVHVLQLLRVIQFIQSIRMFKILQILVNDLISR